MAGPIADNFEPKALLISTLACAAMCNAFMFQSGVYTLDLALWGGNGFAQAFIWPALAMIFFNWFGQSKAKGTLYSMLSTNQNVGSAITPLILQPLVKMFDWKAALWAPAIVGTTFSFLLLFVLRASPSSSSSSSSTITKPKKVVDNAKQIIYKKAVWRLMTTSDVWMLGLGYALLTTVRVGMSDWGLVMLRQHRGATDASARNCLVGLEFGGFIGGICAGISSDSVFKGRRVPVMVLFSILLSAPALWGVFFGEMWMLPWAYMLFGFGAFGPHVMVGLLARELFPEASSTAGSFSKSLAQVGGALSGVPVSLIVERYGWASVGWIWIGCAALSGMAFLTLLGCETNSREKAKVD